MSREKLLEDGASRDRAPGSSRQRCFVGQVSGRDASSSLVSLELEVLKASPV